MSIPSSWFCQDELKHQLYRLAHVLRLRRFKSSKESTRSFKHPLLLQFFNKFQKVYLPPRIDFHTHDPILEEGANIKVIVLSSYPISIFVCQYSPFHFSIIVLLMYSIRLNPSPITLRLESVIASFYIESSYVLFIPPPKVPK